MRREVIIAGLDEAGYGPTLGPMVVTAACFAGGRGPLARALQPAAGRAVKPGGGPCLRVDDSKIVYRGGAGLADLETTSLAFWRAAAGRLPETLGELLAGAGFPNPDIEACPWYGAAPLAQRLPVAADRGAILAGALRLEETLAKSGFAFLGFQTRVVFEPGFNRGISAIGNKANFLAGFVMDLLAACLRAGPAAQYRLRIDKLGGRNRYGALLAKGFPHHGITAVREGHALSRYGMRSEAGAADLCFIRGGDRSHFSVALASMFGKYVREVFMHRFNSFWSAYDPNLRPTAGYPSDARRFLRDFRPAADAAGVDPAAITRIL